ncbi:T9SS type A sorting domain-containing protein [Flavobacterium sp. 3HN19-14]|uniref:T9SS type A sorting domain-containing protein n=1 Tax=Flavobacterium sp. 3HN19-14 TaxID=3448133 RepID=UPI003EDF754E
MIGHDTANVFTAQTGDIEGTVTALNPLFGELAANGGLTFTHALLLNSPAYNAGDPNDNFNDQNDQSIFGSRRDIGASEAQTELGVENIAIKTKSTIYPNPSNGIINVSLSNAHDSETTASIVEVGSGKIVKTFSTNTSMNQFNMGNIAAGVYILKLDSDNYTETHKLVIGR